MKRNFENIIAMYILKKVIIFLLITFSLFVFGQENKIGSIPKIPNFYSEPVQH